MSGIAKAWGTDLRSLALFRAGLGLLLLADLADRSRDLVAHYTDFGLLPRVALLERLSADQEWYVSIHLINGTAPIQAVLFAVAAVFALALLVGYRTRLATCVSWFLLISLHVRNPMVLQAGDILLRLLLFWSMFLPLGARWSVDAALSARDARPPDEIFSVGSLALMLQVALVYWFGSLLKSGRDWLPDGTAVYYALHIDQFGTPLGLWLRGFPGLLRLLTYGVFFFEALGPFLLLSPILKVPLRLLGVAGFVVMHLSIGLFMRLGLFPWIDIVAVLVFLPGRMWDRLEARVRAPERAGLRGRAAAVGARVSRRVARGGRWLHQALEAILPRREPSYRPSVGSNVLAAALLLYVVAWNLTTLPKANFAMPPGTAWIGRLLRIDQRWDMFSPAPLKDDGWYVMPGRLEDGTEVDVWNRRETPVVWEKPALVARTYHNQRWQKYMMNLWLQRNATHRLPYGQYLCRAWNHERQPERALRHFQIYFVREDTLPNGEIGAPTPVLLWTHACFGSVA